jgi:hypothetical protein
MVMQTNDQWHDEISGNAWRNWPTPLI